MSTEDLEACVKAAVAELRRRSDKRVCIVCGSKMEEPNVTDDESYYQCGGWFHD